MIDERSLERAARSWIEAGPTRAPEHAVREALQRIDHTTQERGLRVPSRFPAMTTPLRLAVLISVGVLVLAGIGLLGGFGSSPPAASPPAIMASPTPGASALVGPSPTPDAAVVLPTSGAGQVLSGVGQPLPTFPPGAVDSLVIGPNGPDKPAYTTGAAGIAVLPVANQTANWWSIDVLNPGPGMGPCNAEKRSNRQPSCDLAPGETGILDLADYASGQVEVHVYQSALGYPAPPTIVTVNIPATSR